jgi:hypothetical protein
MNRPLFDSLESRTLFSGTPTADVNVYLEPAPISKEAILHQTQQPGTDAQIGDGQSSKLRSTQSSTDMIDPNGVQKRPDNVRALNPALEA